MILSGTIISKTGLAVPIVVIGSAIATIAAGLLYTLDIGTTTGEWIGYQILGGVGWGFAFQVPIIIAQSNAHPEDVSSITAMILFFQNFGGTTLLGAAQSAFANELIKNVQKANVGINATDVVMTGATQIRMCLCQTMFLEL